MTGILVAVDSTPAAVPVLQTAALLARRLGWTAQALHVGPGPGPRAECAEVGLALHVIDGEPEREVVAAAARAGAELVVIALHRLPAGRAAGHMVDVLARALRVPLLVVPPGAPVRPAVERVLFSLDGSASVSEAARSAILTFSTAGIEVRALHVFEPRTVPHFHDGAPDDEVWRDEFLAQNCAELDVTLATSPGPLVPALLRAASRQEVDIVVLASRDGTSARGTSVIHEVLQAADRPVALVSLTPEVAPVRSAPAGLGSPGRGGTTR